MRYSLDFSVKEYEKVSKYLEEYGYISEVTGSIRRRKEDVGDIDIVVTKKNSVNLEHLEEEVLNLIGEYEGVKERLNRYEFLLKKGITIHLIPEIENHFNYTLWHSTGPKSHIVFIKKLYMEKSKKINKNNIKEKQIYQDIGIAYLSPEKRWNML